jgi:hypothetical protein
LTNNLQDPGIDEALARRSEMAAVCEHKMSAQWIGMKITPGHENEKTAEKEKKSRKRIYVIAAPGTGTDRAAQSLVVYPALKKLPFESCRDLFSTGGYCTGGI